MRGCVDGVGVLWGVSVDCNDPSKAARWRVQLVEGWSKKSRVSHRVVMEEEEEEEEEEGSVGIPLPLPRPVPADDDNAV